MKIIFPKNWQEKTITAVLVIAVMGLLVPTVTVMAYQSYSQQRMLSRVDKFIEKYGDELTTNRYGDIEKLFGYTGDGGRLGVIFKGEIDRTSLEKFVSEKDDAIKVMYIGVNRK